MMDKVGFRFDTGYVKLPSIFFHVDSPAEFPHPQVEVINEALAAELGLDFSGLSEGDQAALLCGNLIPDGAVPFSQAYAGHQFGHFTNLGDGRAHMLGEHLCPAGERVDIQFKGSGRTRYSRGGDGLAAVGPMLREYIISEALHALGIPTTRSLAVVTTGQSVMRERALPGAVLTRVASSHIRVGTFAYAAATQDPRNLSELLDYTIARHYPELATSADKALDLLKVVMERQIKLVVDWMRVGFIHGVMNTDNMALSGESIDFGPCAFLDHYDPEQVFSSIDRGGRYAYANQPPIAQWNLARLAEALLPAMGEKVDESAMRAEEVLMEFPEIYERQWLAMMRKKLGLAGEEETDRELVKGLLEWMHKTGADFTNTFRDLVHPSAPTAEIYAKGQFADWYCRFAERRLMHGQSLNKSITLMQSTNPAVIPRNHVVEQALSDAGAGDLTTMHNLLSVLADPYDHTTDHGHYHAPAPPSESPYQTFCGT